MKTLLSDPDNHCKNVKNRLVSVFEYRMIPALALLMLAACENDIQKIKTITAYQKLPELSGQNYEIIQSDSGKVIMRIIAPEITKFTLNGKPCIEFPQGMTAYFYDTNKRIESVIQAAYVTYLEEEGLWEARNNVEARNLIKGNQLNTEHLFWDQKKRLIYSYTYSKIVNENGTFYGENGFEANQNFSWWKLKGTKGTVNVKDE